MPNVSIPSAPSTVTSSSPSLAPSRKPFASPPQVGSLSKFSPVLHRPHMKTTRVRSIAAAARGSTLKLPLGALPLDTVTLSPIHLPWASLLCSNPAFPSIDVVEDQMLIGRKAPCGLIVNHQAISGIHCRLYRKGEKAETALNEGEPTAVTTGALHKVEESKECGDGSDVGGEEEEEDEESEDRVRAVDAVIDDKNKRKSKIKVSEMLSFFPSATPRPSSPSPPADSPDEVLWKGTKNAKMSQQRLDCPRPHEMWLEDLSTNGTWLGEDATGTKVGHGLKVPLRNGSVFTLLLPTSGNSHERISYTLRVNGESPVGVDDDAPTETVTLVFTDIESSTNLWEACPQVMQAALEEHDRVLRTLLARFRGYEVKTEGDAFMVAFFTVLDAVKWCLAVQEAFLRMKWDDALLHLPSARKEYIDASGARVLEGTDAQLVFNGLRVRMGLHVGQPSCRRNPTTKRMDYYGKVVNLAARVSDAGHGGQIVCTKEVCQIVQEEVQREKERAEQEWVEEREEEDEEDSDEEDIIPSPTDPSPHPHQRLDSITPPTSQHSTGTEETFSALLHPPSTVSPSPASPRRPPMSPDRVARITSHLKQKPSTLDHTLEHLTDLHSVTFVDCGSVALKGIAGPTRIFQVSSVSLTGRRWEPALRAKGVKEGGEGKTVVGESAPEAPPGAPLTLTLYNKHSIPVQIQRNILRSRRRAKMGSLVAEGEEPTTPSPTVQSGPPPSAESPRSVEGSKGALKGSGESRKSQRGSVRFAGAGAATATPSAALATLAELVQVEERRMAAPPPPPSHDGPSGGDTLDLSQAQLPIVQPSRVSAAVAKVEAVTAPTLPVRSGSRTGSSALAASIMQSRGVGASPRQSLLGSPSPHVTPPPPALSPSASTRPAPTAPSATITGQFISAPVPLSTPSSPTLSASAKPFLPSATSSMDSVPLGDTNLSHSVSSPPSPGPPLSSLSLSRAPRPPSHRHRRSISSSHSPISSHTFPRSHSRKDGQRQGEIDRMAEGCSAAFEAEARQRRGGGRASGVTVGSRAQPRGGYQARRYATLNSHWSEVAGCGRVQGVALGGPGGAGEVEALYAQQQAQIRAQVIAQQQAHAYSLQLLFQQQQQLQTQWLYLQQQQGGGGVGVGGGGGVGGVAEAQGVVGGGAVGQQLFFPPAQTPPFGLSPAVSSSVPFSYSFPAGSQWTGWL